MFFIRETSTKVPRCCAFEIETSAEHVLEDVAGFGFASKAENDFRALLVAVAVTEDCWTKTGPKFDIASCWWTTLTHLFIKNRVC